MVHLFDPFHLREVTFRNRIGVSPMCTYSATDGLPNDWHLAHLGSRAVGGAGLVLTEATAVEPRGRISPADTGLWSDTQIPAWARIVRFVQACGAVAGIQLAHAGRKAGTHAPWQGRGPVPEDEGGWEPVGPSPVPFKGGYRTPHVLSEGEMEGLLGAWESAARRSVEAGFRVLEIHMAHGYLLHQYLSPIANHRDDHFGGTLENRMRFPLAVARAVRAAVPQEMPVLVRISVTDWVPGGWTADQAVVFCRHLREHGIDLIDCSSGGSAPDQQVPIGPGYQIPFAERVRREAGIATAAVGMITEPTQADEAVRHGRADLIMVGREMLRDPYWPLRAASELGCPVPWPRQYDWAVR